MRNNLSPWPVDCRFILAYLGIFLFWKQLVYGPFSYVYLRLIFIVLFIAICRAQGLPKRIFSLGCTGAWIKWIALTAVVRMGLKLFLPYSSSAISSAGFWADVVVAPINEEIFFRGIILGIMLRAFEGQIANIALVTLLFVGGHSGLNDGMTLLSLMTLGALLTLCSVKSGSVVLCIICHSIWNLLGFVQIHSFLTPW
jgi:membrane protease YdiL (CAAX protease family)